jgi:hypothetical protein
MPHAVSGRTEPSKQPAVCSTCFCKPTPGAWRSAPRVARVGGRSWDWQDNFKVIMGMNKIYIGLERYNISVCCLFDCVPFQQSHHPPPSPHYSLTPFSLYCVCAQLQRLAVFHSPD